MLLIQPALSSLNSWTDSIWINVSAATLSNWTCLMSGRWNNPSAFGFDTYFKSSVAIEIPDSGQSGWIANQLTNSVSIAPDTWTMITQTVTTNQYQLYVNGVLVGTQSFSGTPQLMFPQAKGFVLGGAGTGNNFVGSMDDFYLFSSVLSAAQIQKVYQNQVVYFGSALPANTPVQLASGATFDLNGSSQTIDSLADSAGGGGTVTSSATGAATLSLAPTGSTTFSGRIQDGAGQVALALNGSGIQVLAGSNTYTGGTTINSGMLVAANGTNGSATGSGTVTLSGGTLASGISGGSISGGVVVGSVASEIAPGGIGSIGHLTIGSLTTASNLTTLNFDLTTPGGSGDLLTITNGLTLAPAHGHYLRRQPDDRRRLPADRRQLRHADAQLFRLFPPPRRADVRVVHDRGLGLHRPGGVGDIVGDRRRRPTAVPEPSTFVLLGVAAVGLFGYAWRGGGRNASLNESFPVEESHPLFQSKEAP